MACLTDSKGASICSCNCGDFVFQTWQNNCQIVWPKSLNQLGFDLFWDWLQISLCHCNTIHHRKNCFLKWAITDSKNSFYCLWIVQSTSNAIDCIGWENNNPSGI